MHITELEDLQVVSLDDLSSHFKKDSVIQEEEVVSKAAVEMTVSATEVLKCFQGEFKSDNILLVKSNLHNILRWSSITAYILGEEVKTTSDVEEAITEWPDEVIHCGILASLMLAGRVAELSLDYFIEDSEEQDASENLNDIVSLVDVLARRIGITFLEVLKYTPSN